MLFWKPETISDVLADLSESENTTQAAMLLTKEQRDSLVADLTADDASSQAVARFEKFVQDRFDGSQSGLGSEIDDAEQWDSEADEIRACCRRTIAMLDRLKDESES